MKNIEFSIKPDGSIEMDLKGYHGKDCDKIAKEFAKELGISVVVKKKREYYSETKEDNSLHGK